MSKKKSDKAILAEIRQTLDDVGMRIETTELAAGKTRVRFHEGYAFDVIRDLAQGTEGHVTRVYRAAKAKSLPTPAQ